jgi:hypothetical protein
VDRARASKQAFLWPILGWYFFVVSQTDGTYVLSERALRQDAPKQVEFKQFTGCHRARLAAKNEEVTSETARRVSIFVGRPSEAGELYSDKIDGISTHARK